MCNCNNNFDVFSMILIPGSGSFRRGTKTELLRNGSTKTRKFKIKKGTFLKLTNPILNPNPNPNPFQSFTRYYFALSGFELPCFSTSVPQKFRFVPRRKHPLPGMFVVFF